MPTGMDRLVAALQGAPCDRIPVFCNFIDQGAVELGLSPREYFASGENVAEAQLRLLARHGHDNVWALFYVGKEAELAGCREILFAPDGPPNVADFVVKRWEDIPALEIPADVAGHPAFEEVRRCLRLLRREVGGKNPICAYVTSTMTLPALLMGMDRWMELLFMGPRALRDELLEKCHQLFVREVAAYRAEGADVIVYSNPMGSTDTVPRRFFLDESLPWIERDVRGVGAGGLVYYCGMAAMNPVIPDVLARTGLSAYYLSPFDDVAEGRRLVGGRGLTCGVINDIPLIDWTPAQVEAEVRRILEAGMPGGRFLFGTGVLPRAIPPANIRVMLEAAFRYGRRDGTGR